MGRPENGIYIVQGEINVVVTALKRNSRWNSHTHNDYENEPLLNTFTQLKDVLNNITDLDELTPNEFLGAFLEVIRSEDTTGPITGLALTSVNKFLSYGLIDEKCETAAAAIENIADAVTHARFVGTDPSSDEVVLMKILHVLRTMMLTPAGRLLTNESVCEIMQSCFRICFEMRLSELLRKSAEHTLMDMVQLLFTRLPQFKEDPKWALSLKKLKMKTGGMDAARKLRKKSPKVKQKKAAPPPPAPIATQPEARQSEGVGEQRLQNIDEKEEEVKAVSPPNSFPEPLTEDITAESQEFSAEEELARAGEVIATTPVTTGNNKSVVDMQQGFQEVDEVVEKPMSPPPTPHTISIAPDIDGTSHLCAEDDAEADMSLEVTEGQRADANDDASQGTKEALQSSQIEETQCLGVPEELSKSESDLDPTCSEPEAEGGNHVHSNSGHQTTVSPTSPDNKEYINQQGVRFMPHHPHTHGPLIPYGLPCVRELFRFLVSLTNPVDRHNTDVMIHMGLNLLTVAMESGADHISHYSSLMCLVKDDMCKNLFFLLQSERLSLFAASIRVCFLLFESMRSHLKFQLEMYFTKLMDVITSESPKISYEQHEMALESVVQLLRIPGLVTELYMNYDCDLYCSNLFEDLTKLLSKNAFPVSGLFSTHLLSLDALLAVIDSIEQHCHHRILTTATEASKNTTQTEAKEEENHDSQPMDTIAPPLPPSSGYTVGKMMPSVGVTQSPEMTNQKKPGRDGNKSHKPRIRPNRMKVMGTDMPTEEQLLEVKRKKKLYQTGTEQFNIKPSKGIAFLQEHDLLSKPLNPNEVALFLREDPKLDKKMIGEYISSKKNTAILEAFIRSFNFEDTRLDEALRMFLESFRLPGEAPVISYIMEHFSASWHKTVGEPFANSDAAFTLTYAIIMLNVDQHNQNAKKQNKPMVIEEFKKNVKKCNGKKDFEQDMLDDIFNAIASDEIVMPSEQTGLVRENYLWKVLLKRGSGKEAVFTHAPTGYYDRDLFSLVWGPTVAALSFVFDKSSDDTIVQKSTSGFRKCALIAAHYGMSDVFDNLVISLCKFTTLLSNVESQESIPIQFGSNMKAKLAARTVFGLAHRHGDILREGWKNILDCMLQLYRGKMLPEVLITVEDFLDPTGRISLLKEEKQTIPRNDSGVLSSFYSYFTMAETPQQRGPSAEEQEAIKQGQACIDDCHVEQLIQESKFLRMDSLQELMKALIFASRPENQESMTSNGNHCEEESAIFYLELLVKVVLQNRDRVTPFWQSIRDHLYHLVVNADEHSFLVERAVVGLLRIAIRLLRREDIAPQVLSSLRILLTMKPNVVHSVCKQIAFGLHDLLKTNAANIHSLQDWFTLFTLLEVSGAGAHPPPIMEVSSKINVPESISDAGAQSDSEVTTDYTPVDTAGCQREYQSDSELYDTPSRNKLQDADVRPLPSAGSWQMVSSVNREDVSQDNSGQQETASTLKPTSGNASKQPPHSQASMDSINPVNQFNITLTGELVHHDNKALVKSCETLAFLVRDAAHITPHNFESCVHCLRTFVEASIDGGQQAREQRKAQQMQQQQQQKQREKKRFRKKHMKKSTSSPSQLQPLTDSEEDEQHDSYYSLSIQLLDLMHTLHTRAASIFSSWAEEEEHQKNLEEPTESSGSNSTATSTSVYTDSFREVDINAKSSSLWLKCWCPLLQGIARLCCDSRRHVRSQALTYLQRALLVHDLQTLSPAEWENCFNKVLFPLLHLLLENNNIDDPGGIEETRMRASTLLCKVFLQHLTPLLSLSTFTALWLTILDFMDKYMHADNSDLLCEAIPESLKNMLLVMHTAGILSASSDESQLWKLTWDRIDTFLPNLRDEVFKPHQIEPRRPVMDRDPIEEGNTTSNSVAVPTTEAQVSQPSTAGPSPGGSPGVSQQSSIPQQQQPPNPANPQTANTQETTVDSPPRSGSPLMQAPTPPASTGAYILHPPLPQMSSPGNQGALPIILNPELIQGSAIPILHSQGTPEKKPELTAAQHSVVREY